MPFILAGIAIFVFGGIFLTMAIKERSYEMIMGGVMIIVAALLFVVLTIVFVGRAP